MTTETAGASAIPFDTLQDVLNRQGALPAIDALCDELKRTEDFQHLFYARLLRKRVELNVSPFPTGLATELPPAVHQAYEDAIRQAGREVGQLHLDRDELAKAWGYFRMLDEPEPVRAALERYNPGPDDDTYGAVEIAWQQGVHPQRGFDLVLERSGICSSITMVSSADLTRNPDVRDYCVKRLIRALHAQLHERITSDFTSRGVAFEPGASIGTLLASQEDAFGEDDYHIDVSHLNSVVQMALQLSEDCDELRLARELCEYGDRLSPNLRSDSHPPFEQSYADFKVYLDVLSGRDVEASLEHFVRKLPGAAEQGDTFPAEVLVNLLVRINRLPMAVGIARQYLMNPEGRELSCPSVSELARRAADYTTAAEAARRAADPVTYLASLIALKNG